MPAERRVQARRDWQITGAWRPSRHLSVSRVADRYRSSDVKSSDVNVGGLAIRWFHSVVTAYAQCDLPCGVYDPAQARIEAESIKAIMEKYHGNDDPV